MAVLMRMDRVCMDTRWMVGKWIEWSDDDDDVEEEEMEES
jgi:hypothetical protein